MDLLRYDGKRVVITGAATGMGHETTRLLVEAGADVTALDVAEVHQPGVDYVRADLGDPASIDDAVGRLPASVDVLMNCAGIPGGTRFSPIDVMKVNYLGLRHLTEAVLPRIPDGGAVVHIASIAGGNWFSHIAELRELQSTTGFDDGIAWLEAHAELIGDGYFFSKEAVQFYTLFRSVTAVKDGVRVNSICPGVTDTKIMPDFRQSMGDGAINMTADVGIGRLATPDEMAPAMLFLGDSRASSYINGVNLVIDGGFSAAAATGQVDYAKYLS
jgi:NAD(P)-dependent dehydrogenase (short-subunit alcohol dehydrogenase family)